MPQILSSIRCCHCKEDKATSEFTNNKNTKTGKALACKKCVAASVKPRLPSVHRAYYEKNKIRILTKRRAHKQTFIGRFLTYKGSAKSFGRSFELTQDEFKCFWQKPCFYCGDSIRTIGLDRIDSSKGYTFDNVVSCCATCNRMKLDSTLQNFIKRCGVIWNRCQHLM